MTFTVREQDLAESLLPGPSMSYRIQELRRKMLHAGQDFIKRGNAVLYSAAGVERLAELLRGEAISKKDGDREKREIVEAAVMELPRLRVRVTRIFPTNPRYLHAEAMDKTNLSVTVRVRDNRNFMPGMKLDVLRSLGGVWDYVGYLPRARGRW